MKSGLAVALASILLIAATAAARAATSPAPASPSHAPAAHAKTAEAVTPSQALDRLEGGNRRYVSAALVHPDQTPARRAEEAKGQHPVAVIVSCSDSRVPPEIVFDQGLGDLFVIRTAGNRLDDLVLASIEYAVEHLGCELVMVMGHERCGAVTAAVEAAAHGAETKAENPEATGNHVPVLVRTMSDAVAATVSMPGDKVENAMIENVRIVVKGVTAQSPYLAARVRAGALRVVGARYDLDSGKVTLVDGESAGHTTK